VGVRYTDALAGVDALPSVGTVGDSHTYRVAVEALRHNATRRIGTVAWGSGKACPSNGIATVASRAVGVHANRYRERCDHLARRRLADSRG
jgi:hypothetical protein